ncbi:MAG TPA: DapH/DapD/GlmU-related protein [Candidatus Dormibacteraeota bacterium]|nr:DapH/DapD/GlmU-related protein [Candidatus Dormibacteraeota bacterium]
MRILKYRMLSDCPNVQGNPVINQPVQMVGKGTIRFGEGVVLGCFPSAFFFNGYIYIEARQPESVIEFGDGVCVNNNCVVVSDGAGILLGKKTMLGTHCEVIDSDFHDLHPEHRTDGVAKRARVMIDDNVLIGGNVRIMKGVRIGKNAVIANGSVVTRSIPENAVGFGNPARGGFGLMPEATPRSQPDVAHA